MKNLAKIILIPIIDIMNQLGFNLGKILSLKYYPRFRKNKKEWIANSCGIYTFKKIND
ncbi:hypothetical protein OAR40_01495 [Candidatus Pelagibacter sp.]|nr:hypothetical protein [Candidatus Pelagibacter sp.]